MTTPEMLTAIQHTGLARVITKSNHLVIASLQIVHIFGFLLLLGSLLLMSLSRLGLTLRSWDTSLIAREPLRLFLIGQAFTLISGLLMFLTGTMHYFYNAAFELKMVLLTVALVTQAWLFSRFKKNPEVVSDRWLAVFALLLWFSIAIAGRAIGFV